MNKKSQELDAIWDNMISEDDVVEKFKISKVTLRSWRASGKIKVFRYAFPGTTGNAARPGKNPIYSKAELIGIFNPVA